VNATLQCEDLQSVVTITRGSVTINVSTPDDEIMARRIGDLESEIAKLKRENMALVDKLERK
jgi:hypothetical protein